MSERRGIMPEAVRLGRTQYLDLFAATTVLPAQWASQLLPQLRPEQRLMLAILCEALGCIRKRSVRNGEGDRHAQQALHDAYVWIEAQEDQPYLCSFTQVCWALGINPTYLRKRILTVYPRPSFLHAASRCPAATVPPAGPSRA